MSTVYRPGSLKEALEILASEPVVPIGGGTDLMVRHRRHGAMPVRLEKPPMFIAALPEIRTIEQDGDTLRIGAAVTLTELLGHPAVSDGLKLALREFAAPAIRNSGTIAGNVCNASPAADTLPYLYAAGAMIELTSSNNTRTVPIEAFVTGPGSTARQPDELVTAVLVPMSTDGYQFYRKVAPRRSNALSKLSVYAEARRGNDPSVAYFRLAIGAVAPTVVRVGEAEDLVVGKSAKELPSIAASVVERLTSQVKPISDQRSTEEYRRNTALKIVRYLLEQDLPPYLEKT